jgi:hypothetical protein
MNINLIADRGAPQNSCRYAQSNADKLQSMVGGMASENEQLCSVTQQLVEANALFAVDRQNLQAVQEQLDLAMARLERCADELERVNQKRTDEVSAEYSLMRQLLSSRKVKKRQATQFTLTLGQQNIQIEKLQATLSQARSHEASGFGRTGDGSLTLWNIITVKSDDITMNSYTFVISLRAIPAQDMSFCVPGCLIFRCFRQLTGISEPN